jgi:hypothetical protein
MKRKKMSHNRPSYVHPEDRDHRNAKDDTTSSVFGGHRQGKRKRGTSVTKSSPRETVHAIPMDVTAEDGRIIALGVTMVSHRPTEDEVSEAEWNGLAPLNYEKRALPALPTSSGKTLATRGNVKVRRQVITPRERVEPTAVHRFLTVCNEILARPIACRELPEDYVPRTYAKSKALPPDPWGRV